MDLWSYLKGTDKPKIIYGMGNGADKILSVFELYGIKADGIFASDEFYREGKSFHDMPVLRYSDFCEKYYDFIVLVSFATNLPEVRANILRIAFERELYAPCVPVYGDTLFTEEYYNEHRNEIGDARALFADELSREVFDNIINYRLTGKLEYLLASECDKKEPWERLLHTKDNKVFADLGAYTGDTALEFLSFCPDAEKIYAMEPDPRNFRKLSAIEDERIVKINKGAWDKEQTLEFNMGAGRGASQTNKGKTVLLDFDSLDRLLDGERVDYIKYDVEGSEEKALFGSRKTIELFSPDLLVSLYHRSEDIFKLPILVHGFMPEYKLYLRRFEYIPDWDINLYAIRY
ncbi:MAG: FkbM family methyltransferase [Ruminococcaceae bacterium]|nr:FkbM family methyltransferase [Oscillospiraceae bacterium]